MNCTEREARGREQPALKLERHRNDSRASGLLDVVWFAN